MMLLTFVSIGLAFPRPSSAFNEWALVQGAPCVDDDDNLMGPSDPNRVSIAGGAGWLWTLGCDDDSGVNFDFANSTASVFNNNNVSAGWFKPAYFDTGYGGWIPVRADSIYAARSSPAIYLSTNPDYPQPGGPTEGLLYKYDPTTGIRTQLPGGSGWHSVAADVTGDVYSCGYSGTSCTNGPCLYELSNNSWSKQLFAPACQQVTVDGSDGYTPFIRDGQGNVYHRGISCVGRFCFPTWPEMPTQKCDGSAFQAQLIAAYNGIVYALDSPASTGPANVYSASTSDHCWGLLSTMNNQMKSIGIDNSNGSLYGNDASGNLWRWSLIAQ
jgi:hypothetical protein